MMTQPHTHTPHQQIIQAHKEPSIVKSIEIRTDESDTSTAANDITTGHHIHNTTADNQSNNDNNSNSNTRNIIRSGKKVSSKQGNNTTMTPTNDTTASAAKSEVNGDLVEDVNAIAYTCLEAFLQEVKEFQEVI